MSRGLFASLLLHGALFFLVLLGPGPRRFEWERADAIPVELVAPVVPEPEPEPEPPRPKLDPTPEPVEKTSAPDPLPEVEPPAPTPVAKPVTKPRPKRVYKPLAPRHADDEPSLEERLRARLTEAAAVAEDSLQTWSAPEDPASAPSTTEVEAADFPYAWYLNVLQNKITDSWDPPGDRMIDRRDNHALVRFRVHRDGRVTDLRVEGASGTPGLDASARRAVDRARPFPPLPESYEGEVLDVGVRFTVAGSRS